MGINNKDMRFDFPNPGDLNQSFQYSWFKDGEDILFCVRSLNTVQYDERTGNETLTDQTMLVCLNGDSNASKQVPISEFSNWYKVCRPKLGWFNIKIPGSEITICKYFSQTNQVTYSKGLRAAELEVTAFHRLNELFNLIYAEKPEVSKAFLDKLKAYISRDLRVGNSVEAYPIMKQLLEPRYFRSGDILNGIRKKSLLGGAITRDLAVCLNVTGGCSIYYRLQEIGQLNPNHTKITCDPKWGDFLLEYFPNVTISNEDDTGVADRTAEQETNF